MKVTAKGQVTIPIHIRDLLNINPNSEVNFVEEEGRVYLKKKSSTGQKRSRFRALQGRYQGKFTSKQILSATRGD